MNPLFDHDLVMRSMMRVATGSVAEVFQQLAEENLPRHKCWRKFMPVVK